MARNFIVILSMDAQNIRWYLFIFIRNITKCRAHRRLLLSTKFKWKQFIHHDF